MPLCFFVEREKKQGARPEFSIPHSVFGDKVRHA